MTVAEPTYRQVGWLTQGELLLPMFDRYGDPITTPEGWEPYRPVYVVESVELDTSANARPVDDADG